METDLTHITRFRVKKDKKSAENDVVVIEEPLQIDLFQKISCTKELCSIEPNRKEASQKETHQKESRQTYSITMRTPGNDQFLAYGLLFSEGVISRAKDVESMASSIVADADEDEYDGKGLAEANLLTVNIVPTFILDLDDKPRRLASYSGCGICGKTSLKALTLKNPRELRKLHVDLTCSDVLKIRETLTKQTLFSETGGSHVAGLVYEVFSGGECSLDFNSVRCFEDVGRHNALDKLMGFELVNNDLIHSGVVILSGRIGFELVQKVVMAGFSTIVALGAPTSLAIKAANQFGLTLIGFAKDEHYNLYTF